MAVPHSSLPRDPWEDVLQSHLPPRSQPFHDPKACTVHPPQGDNGEQPTGPSPKALRLRESQGRHTWYVGWGCGDEGKLPEEVWLKWRSGRPLRMKRRGGGVCREKAFQAGGAKCDSGAGERSRAPSGPHLHRVTGGSECAAGSRLPP